MYKESNRFKIMVDYLLSGRIIDHDSFRYAMDENYGIGFVAVKDGVDCLIGDRLTFGQAFKLAQNLSEECVLEMAVHVANIPLIKKRRNESG